MPKKVVRIMDIFEIFAIVFLTALAVLLAMDSVWKRMVSGFEERVNEEVKRRLKDVSVKIEAPVVVWEDDLGHV